MAEIIVFMRERHETKRKIEISWEKVKEKIRNSPDHRISVTIGSDLHKNLTKPNAIKLLALFYRQPQAWLRGFY